MASLEELKAAMDVVCDVKFNGVDGGEVYMKGTVDAVIAHLEGELIALRIESSNAIKILELTGRDDYELLDAVRNRMQEVLTLRGNEDELVRQLSECQERENFWCELWAESSAHREHWSDCCAETESCTGTPEHDCRCGLEAMEAKGLVAIKEFERLSAALEVKK